MGMEFLRPLSHPYPRLGQPVTQHSVTCLTSIECALARHPLCEMAHRDPETTRRSTRGVVDVEDEVVYAAVLVEVAVRLIVLRHLAGQLGRPPGGIETG